MGIEWRKDSIKAIHAEQAAAAKTAAMVAQVQVAAKVFASAAVNIPDTQALEMPDMFPSWEDVLSNGVELQKGHIISKDQALYRVQNKVTPQAHQPPGGEGMLAVYRPIDQSHAGTLEDPIPWVYGMDCHAGVYFSYQGHIYRVAVGGDMVPCVWTPGTPGLWQWELIS